MYQTHCIEFSFTQPATQVGLYGLMDGAAIQTVASVYRYHSESEPLDFNGPTGWGGADPGFGQGGCDPPQFEGGGSQL